MAAGFNCTGFTKLVIDQSDVSGSRRKWHMEFTLAVRINMLEMGKVNVGTSTDPGFRDNFTKEINY